MLIFDKGARKYQSKIFTVKDDDVPEVGTLELVLRVTPTHCGSICI